MARHCPGQRRPLRIAEPRRPWWTSAFSPGAEGRGAPVATATWTPHHRGNPCLRAPTRPGQGRFWQDPPRIREAVAWAVVDNPGAGRDSLASRRAKITPERAGLTLYGRTRRVPGLRREE